MSEELVLPLESAKFIMQHAKDVTIDDQGVSQVAEKILKSMHDKNCNYFDWKSFDLNPKTMDEFAFKWIFLVDTLNFSFWSMSSDNRKEAKYRVIYKNKTYEGYWGLCAAINRAIDEGIRILDADYMANVTEPDLRYILRSDSEVNAPLFDERLRILRESGKILIEKFNGTFMKCVEMAKGSAKELLRLVVENFPSYRDESIFEAKRVTFYKRAQILIADVWACFEGKELGYFYDIDDITMFADYRVPQVLHYYDVLKYSPQLNDFLNENKLMKSGDRYEIEIRAASILACNRINDAVKKLSGERNSVALANSDAKTTKKEINDILVDFYLWNFRVDHASEIDLKSPFHKIRGIFY